jgi:hypothetical protein
MAHIKGLSSGPYGLLHKDEPHIHMIDIPTEWVNSVHNDTIKANMIKVAKECYVIASSTKASKLEFGVNTKIDSAGILQYYLKVNGFKQKIPSSIMTTYASDTGARSVTFNTLSGEYIFGYADMNPGCNQLMKPRTIGNESRYLDIAKGISRFKGPNITKEPRQSDINEVERVAAILISTYWADDSMKVCFTSISDNAGRVVTVVFQNLNTVLNLFSLEDEDFGKKVQCSPNDGGIEVTLSTKRKRHIDYEENKEFEEEKKMNMPKPKE